MMTASLCCLWMKFILVYWHGIIPAFAPRMTAKDTPDTFEAAAYGTVFFYGKNKITAA